ncbi:MAG: hypothetical protein ACRDPV_02930 [Gaiellaceae bacterium]
MSALEILVLGMLAAVLVLFAIPGILGIEWSCLGENGVQSTGGDTYIAGFAVAGTFGWLGVFLGTMLANIAERRALAVLLPIFWFVALVVAALIVGVLLGPEACPR